MNPSDELYIVGIGASAGGLEALRSFFSSMPEDTGLGFVVIQHLAPDHKSLMVELLGRATRMEVVRADEGMEVEANRIHLIQPGHNLSISEGKLHLEPLPAGKTLNLPIDLFFRSLAEEKGERSIAVVLSGTGSDGARGIRSVKEAGGMVMVQAEASAKFAGMPASAIATGTADFVLPVEDMPSQLSQFARHPYTNPNRDFKELLSKESDDLTRICQRLKEAQGLDFSLYKTATLARRIERRMNVAQLEDLGSYTDYLLQSSAEAEALTKDLLIGVTKFFRDPDFFFALTQPLEDFFRHAPEGSCLRLWSAACSSGEEAYSLAMLCDEIRQKVGRAVDYKVFATDVDKNALDIAGAGAYPQSVVADLPESYLSRYFEPDGNENFVIKRTLRDHLIFARQDLMTDPPFTKIHLITCRNLLIYLQPKAQRKLLGLFHFSLISNGLLFLGSSETLGELSYAFEVQDSRARIFRKVNSVSLRLADAIPTLERGTGLPGGFDRNDLTSPLPSKRNPVNEKIQSILLERYAPATLVLNQQGQLVYTGGNSSTYLQVPTGPTDLDAVGMLPRDLGLAVSTVQSQSGREPGVAEMGGVRFFMDDDGEPELLRVRAEVVDTQTHAGKVTLVTIQKEQGPLPDLSSAESFDVDQQLMNRVAQLEEELRNTRDSLQTSVEQQETANEELQAANEELLAANEELQSTNEELESVNEELYTVNAEYQSKIQELTELNDDMENFTRSTDIGTVFFDQEGAIRRFTPVFGRLTGLSEVDIGRSLSTFAHPVLKTIQNLSKQVIRTRSQLEVVVDLEEQGVYLLRVSPYRVEQADTDALVASLVDISRLENAEAKLQAVLDTLDLGVALTDRDGRMVRVNATLCRMSGLEENQLIGHPLDHVLLQKKNQAALEHRLEDLQPHEILPWDLRTPENQTKAVLLRSAFLPDLDGGRRLVTFLDPTAMKQWADSLQATDPDYGTP